MADGQSELMLQQTVVEGVRQGDPYYVVAAQAQRMGRYPLRPFTAMRLPTLAVVQAALPPLLVRLVLLLLIVATMVAWVLRVRTVTTRLLPVGIAGGLALAGLYASLEPAFVVLHAVWAGPLIALSLALRRPGDWLPAMALGLCAMLIDEAAILYVAIMAGTAWIEGQRRESLGWLAAVAILGLALAAHAHAVSLVTGPLDLASQAGDGLQGLGFYIRLATTSCALDLVPQWLASLLLGISLFGWLAWRDPVAIRALALLAGYAICIALFASDDTAYAALITTPVLLLGLVFAVDGLRDLIVAARDARRITVTRIVR